LERLHYYGRALATPGFRQILHRIAQLIQTPDGREV
jgi:hypothetical protein